MKIYIATSSGNLTMSPSLKNKLQTAGVRPDVIEALKLAIEATTPKMTSGYVYAQAMEQAFDEYGVEGVKHQVMYMLIYLGKWTGDSARICKRVLKKWSAS